MASFFLSICTFISFKEDFVWSEGFLSLSSCTFISFKEDFAWSEGFLLQHGKIMFGINQKITCDLFQRKRQELTFFVKFKVNGGKKKG